MKREIFSRGVRMQHQFGKTEKINDPVQSETFDLPTPDLSRTGGGRSYCAEVQQYGQHNYRPDPSPVQKPNGEFASTQGPRPDFVEQITRPIPVGTKRRLGPLKTDK
jgi:hypothetical protein